MELGAALGEVREFLDREGIPFAIVGALALHAHGYSRATNDLDLLVGSEAQGRLIAFLEKRGFETLQRSDGYSNHVHADPALGRLDVIYVDEDKGGKIFAEARPRSAGTLKSSDNRSASMSSNDRSEPLDLERGLPTTERDVEALRALRCPRMTDAQYVRFLATLSAPDRALLVATRGPHGAAFSLPRV